MSTQQIKYESFSNKNWLGQGASYSYLTIDRKRYLYSYSYDGIGGMEFERSKRKEIEENRKELLPLLQEVGVCPRTLEKEFLIPWNSINMEFLKEISYNITGGNSKGIKVKCHVSQIEGDMSTNVCEYKPLKLKIKNYIVSGKFARDGDFCGEVKIDKHIF